MSKRIKYILDFAQDYFIILQKELQIILRDNGVKVLFFLAPIAYPLLYNILYWHDLVDNVPVAVVDMSNSPESRAFIHAYHATREVEITHTCTSMQEAEKLMREQDVHGIIFFPNDYAEKIHTANGQAHISLYCDMTSFLYMKSVYMAANQVMLDLMHNIQLDRYERAGMSAEQAWQLVQGVPYEEVYLYAPTTGYPSFLIPAILVFIIHQTLLLGICMLNGTAREENSIVYSLPGQEGHQIPLRIVLAKAMAYFIVYFFVSTYVLVFIPYLFNLPQIGSMIDLYLFLVPFLFATIFFSMTISLFMLNRETCMVLLLPTSLVFLFLSGISWIPELMPPFWRYISHLIPSTWGVNGFVHINSMGATLSQVKNDFLALWLLTAAYLITATVGLYIFGKLHSKQIAQP